MQNNNKHLSGTALSGTSREFKRPKNDFYATPSHSTNALLSVEHFKGSILEPCCGNGAISKVLDNHGMKVVSNDIINRGYGHHFKDFLKEPFCTYSNVITNPPFKYAKSFIKRSLEVTTDKVALFCKIQLLEGISRYHMFQVTPLKHVWVFSKRQNPMRNGVAINPKTGKKWSSTMCFAWFVWQHDYKGKPTIGWLK